MGCPSKEAPGARSGEHGHFAGKSWPHRAKRLRRRSRVVAGVVWAWIGDRQKRGILGFSRHGARFSFLASYWTISR